MEWWNCGEVGHRAFDCWAKWKKRFGKDEHPCVDFNIMSVGEDFIPSRPDRPSGGTHLRTASSANRFTATWCERVLGASRVLEQELGT